MRTSHKNSVHSCWSSTTHNHYFVTTGFVNGSLQIKQANGSSSSSLLSITYLLSSSSEASPRSRRLRFSSCSLFQSRSCAVRQSVNSYNLPAALIVASIVQENAGITECTISGLFVILTHIWLIVESIANCNMAGSPDGTLRSGELVVRELGFCFLYVLMIACGASINFGILQVKWFLFADELFSFLFSLLLHANLFS